MKIKLYLTCVLVAIFGSIGFSQHWCGTHHTEEFMERLEANVKYASTHEVRSPDFKYIPIVFHLVADDDGEGRMNEESVMLQLCRLNNQYIDVGLQYYIESFNYINNSDMFNHVAPNVQGGMNANRVDGVLNFYILASTHNPNVAGYYTIGIDVLVVRKDHFLEEDNITSGHEIGHLLSLAHPHVGWEDEPYTPAQYGETVIITSISSVQASALVEIMDDPNCLNTGDRICDTPPDYGFTQNGGNSSTCNNPWEGIVKDRNGVLIESIPNYIMGYNACNNNIFSEQQMDAMNADYISRINMGTSQTRYMKSGYTPDLSTITAAPSLNYPAIAETVETYNSILFDWEPVPNAHSYIVVIGGGTDLRIPVDTDELFVSQLEANTTYSWKVVPLNEIGYCVELINSNLFFTGNSTSSTNEIEEVNSFQVYPNPTQGATQLKVAMEVEKDVEMKLNILSMDGKLIQSIGTQRFLSGNSIQTISIDNLSDGIYFIKAESSSGTVIKRFVVNK